MSWFSSEDKALQRSNAGPQSIQSTKYTKHMEHSLKTDSERLVACSWRSGGAAEWGVHLPLKQAQVKCHSEDTTLPITQENERTSLYVRQETHHALRIDPTIQGTVPILCQMQNTLRGFSNCPHFQARCVQQDVQTYIVTPFLVRKPVLRHCEST